MGLWHIFCSEIWSVSDNSESLFNTYMKRGTPKRRELSKSQRLGKSG